MYAPIVPLGEQVCVDNGSEHGIPKPTAVLVSGINAAPGVSNKGGACDMVVIAAVHALGATTVGLGSLFMGLFAMTSECAGWLGLFVAHRSAVANAYGNIKPSEICPGFVEPCTYLCGSYIPYPCRDPRIYIALEPTR